MYLMDLIYNREQLQGNVVLHQGRSKTFKNLQNTKSFPLCKLLPESFRENLNNLLWINISLILQIQQHL